GLTTTLKNAWTTSRQVNFFWVANFNLKFGFKQHLCKKYEYHLKIPQLYHIVKEFLILFLNNNW
ncbi:hypothetical protein, partial [Streptococcus pneumoniae]|uniref:hypothetical protein n=1 Tax=Streptococcus pneumoniae TaxID=1313 RepID=UPI001E37101C